MKKYLSSILLFIALLSFNGSLYADSIERSDRLYVSPEEIQISNHGIYYLTDGATFLVSTLHYDQDGIYIDTKDLKGSFDDTCINGHKIYDWDCLGCANWWCPFRCKCHSPW